MLLLIKRYGDENIEIKSEAVCDFKGLSEGASGVKILMIIVVEVFEFFELELAQL